MAAGETMMPEATRVTCLRDVAIIELILGGLTPLLDKGVGEGGGAMEGKGITSAFRFRWKESPPRGRSDLLISNQD